ncbi:MAG: hypothetical protein KDD33_10295 [Bdellovibrionales bacterium]|nr:hypothetical protein [Bdellovibrionales bacterium]
MLKPLVIILFIFSISSPAPAQDSYRESIFSSGSDSESQDVEKAQIKKASSQSKFIGTDNAAAPAYDPPGDDAAVSETTTPSGAKFTGFSQSQTSRPVAKPTPRPRTDRDTKKKTQGGERQGQAPGNFSQISKSVSSAPIWKYFKSVFSQCAPGCSPYGVGTWRKPDGKRSCHHSGNAVDMAGFSCGGKKYSAYTSRFTQFVACVRGKKTNGKSWKVLHRQQTYARGTKHCHNGPGVRTICHWDHGHFSLGCIAGGRKYW